MLITEHDLRVFCHFETISRYGKAKQKDKKNINNHSSPDDFETVDSFKYNEYTSIRLSNEYDEWNQGTLLGNR